MALDQSLECVRAYGLTVGSELPLHVHRLVDTPTLDVTIRLGGRVPTTDDVPLGHVMVQWKTPDGLQATFVRQINGDYLMRFARTCDVHVAGDLTTATIQMAEGASMDMGSVLASGTILSFILLLRGESVLHASAVESDGRAIAFVGRSGMGKSTLATLLCGIGCRLVTDDVLRLTSGLDGYQCSLGATELRLRPSASDLVDDFSGGGLDRRTADHRRALRLPPSTTDNLNLQAIVVPQPRRDIDSVQVVRLGPRAAALTLLRFPRIVGIVDGALQVAQFDQASRVAQAVPVLVADVPWGPPFAEKHALDLLDQIHEMSERPSAATSE